MGTSHEFELLFDNEIEAELIDRQIHIQDEIQRANSELALRQGRSEAKGSEHQRDVVPIISAVAALSPLVVPLVKEIIKRILPHIETETVIEEDLAGRTVIRIIRRES